MMDDKTILFEQTPVPKAVMQLAVPTILSSLVMVIYNLADTYFCGHDERSHPECGRNPGRAGTAGIQRGQ